MSDLGFKWNRGLVSKLESGCRESITVAELVALAQVFDVSPADVLRVARPSSWPIELSEDPLKQVLDMARLVRAIADRFGIEDTDA